MSNKTNSNRANNSVVFFDNPAVSKISGNQDMNEKYFDQFAGVILNMCRVIVDRVVENSADYKAIDEDTNLSIEGKALAKRKLLVADIGIILSTSLGGLGLMCCAKKVLLS